MDDEAGAVEHFYAGDWSAADFGLAREVTYCAQDYEVALKVMLACGLTKRKAYTGLNAENKHNGRGITMQQARLTSRRYGVKVRRGIRE